MMEAGLRCGQTAVPAGAPAGLNKESERNKRMSEETWAGFEAACKACERCGLSRTRTHVVVGRGTPAQGAVLFVGEGPGEQEDLSGIAFTGRAGKLLDLLLAAHRFPQDAWYIANIVKCRPRATGNRGGGGGRVHAVAALAGESPQAAHHCLSGACRRQAPH
jgi:hypothetical protein